MLKKLTAAYIAPGRGLTIRGSLLQGGSGVSTNLHNVYYDTEMRMVVIDFGKKTERRTYVNLDTFGWLTFEGSQQPVTSEQPKRGPGRPKKNP